MFNDGTRQKHLVQEALPPLGAPVAERETLGQGAVRVREDAQVQDVGGRQQAVLGPLAVATARRTRFPPAAERTAPTRLPLLAALLF